MARRSPQAADPLAEEPVERPLWSRSGGSLPGIRLALAAVRDPAKGI